MLYKKSSIICRKKKKFEGFIWYDIEAFVNENGIHEANLIMAKRRCLKCLKDTNFCVECDKKYEFSKIENFVEWVLTE